MLRARGGGLDEAEHLHLVELVYAEDPARVFAGGASLAAKAGGEAGVAQRQALGVEDLFVVQRGERNLGGAHEEELIRREAVDLLLGVGQEAGAVQRPLAHQHRRDHRLEAVRAQLLEDPPHQRQLEHHEVAFEVGEARARELGGVIHVDQRPGQLQVVAGLKWTRPRRARPRRARPRRSRPRQARSRRSRPRQARSRLSCARQARPARPPPRPAPARPPARGRRSGRAGWAAATAPRRARPPQR